MPLGNAALSCAAPLATGAHHRRLNLFIYLLTYLLTYLLIYVYAMSVALPSAGQSDRP